MNQNANAVENVIQRMGIYSSVNDFQSIVDNLNRAKSRKYHACMGDTHITSAIRQYCYFRFHEYYESQSLDDINSIEHHLRSNTVFATWFDKFGMEELITDTNLKKQLSSEKGCTRLKGTIFEAFLHLFALDGNTIPDQSCFNECVKRILDNHFDFEEHFLYKNHSYIDTLHLPYKYGYDYKKEFKRLTNTLLRTIPLNAFPIVKDEMTDMYFVTMDKNPLLDIQPIGYKFSCSFKTKNECLNYMIYHFLKERALVDQSRKEKRFSNK